MVAWWWAGAALAADPTISVAPDGSLVAEMDLSVSPDVAKAALADPVAAAKLTKDVISVTAERKGDCMQLTEQTTGMWNPLEFTSLRCPTSTGYTEKLVASEDFTEMRSEWKFTETAAGTHVTYTVKSVVDLPVPSAVLRKGTEKSMLGTLAALRAKVDPGS